MQIFFDSISLFEDHENLRLCESNYKLASTASLLKALAAEKDSNYDQIK